MRYHTALPQNTSKTTSTKTHHLVAVYYLFLAPWLCPLVGWSPVWLFSSSLYCPSARHIIGLTVSPANSNLVPPRLGLLPERMFVFVSFFIFFPCLGLFPWYLAVLSSYEVLGTLLLLNVGRRAIFLVQYHFAVVEMSSGCIVYAIQ